MFPTACNHTQGNGNTHGNHTQGDHAECWIYGARYVSRNMHRESGKLMVATTPLHRVPKEQGFREKFGSKEVTQTDFGRGTTPYDSLLGWKKDQRSMSKACGCVLSYECVAWNSLNTLVLPWRRAQAPHSCCRQTKQSFGSFFTSMP